MKKALLVPINSKGEILIQDRRDYKKPDWGYFGGSIEANETPVGAVIREAKEELNLDLTEQGLISIGNFVSVYEDKEVLKYFFVYKTDQENFNDLEGKGAHWTNVDKAKELLGSKDRLDEIIRRIEEL